MPRFETIVFGVTLNLEAKHFTDEKICDAGLPHALVPDERRGHPHRSIKFACVSWRIDRGEYTGC